MNMKRVIPIFFAVLLFSIFLTSLSFVSAAPASDIPTQITGFIDGVVKVIDPLAKYILGESVGVADFSAGEILFAKVLFFILILLIVWKTLTMVDFFSDYDWLVWIVAIGVSVLSTRWIGSKLVATILLPYTTLGVAIAAGLPFVIYFFIVNVGFKEKPSIIRKTAWILFAVIFIFLWITRGDVMQGARWIYIGTAIAAFVMAMLDGTISKFFLKMRIERAGKESSEDAITSIMEKKGKLSQLLADGIITAPELKRREKKYNKQLAALHK